MKKGLIILVVLVAVFVGGFVYLMGNAGDFIKQQIESQGSRFLDTPVAVSAVDLAIREGRLTLSNLTIQNPTGFSNANAFSLAAVTLDLGDVSGEPYRVQTVSVDTPEVLYEVDASGNGNLLVLKENLTRNLPAGEAPPEKQEAGSNPLVIIDDVQVKKVRLKLNFENLDTGDFTLPVDQKAYEIELPTFSAGAIGSPNGLPADQVGGAIIDKMLDNIIDQAKAEAKKRLTDAAKAKAKEKLDEQKDKLEEKAKEKLKNLFNG